MSTDADAAITAAAARCLVRDGFQRMTVEGVAAEAGVAKTTVYRRYASTAELARVALVQLNRASPDPDTGDTRADLVELLQRVRERFDLSITGTLLVEEARHPELLEAFRASMIGPAVDRFRNVLRRGVEGGELRADLDIDRAAQRAARLASSLAYLEHGPASRKWATAVVDTLWPALAALGSEDEVVADEALEVGRLEQQGEQRGLQLVAELADALEALGVVGGGFGERGELAAGVGVVEQVEELRVGADGAGAGVRHPVVEERPRRRGPAAAARAARPAARACPAAGSEWHSSAGSRPPANSTLRLKRSLACRSPQPSPERARCLPSKSTAIVRQ